MKILIISEDKSIFEENTTSRNNILKYASSLETLFVMVLNKSLDKNIGKIKQISENTWLYKVSSFSKILKIWKVYKLAKFQLRDRGIFQPNLIITEGKSLSIFSGFLLAKKFKRPLYIYISEINERKFFSPRGIKKFIVSRVLLSILKRSSYVKVDNEKTKEKILKKYPHLHIETIKPFIDFESLLNKAKHIEENTKKENANKAKFTITSFVDNIEDIKLAVDMLRKLNNHYPPSSLTLLPSDDLIGRNLKRHIRKDSRFFVEIEDQKENWGKSISESNIFWGISKGEEYESTLTKACVIGTTIIAKEDEISKNLIENSVTGFICSFSKTNEVIEYFENKTLFLRNNPSTSLTFKMNIPLSFKQQFSESNEEYMKKVKASWETCLKKYQEDNTKFYRY